VNAHYEEVAGFLKERDPHGRVVILSGASSEDLKTLYQGAALFVFPSLSEGFGLPVLEAMACGVPVLAADNTSLPEIMGKVDGLFDAGDAAALAARMESALGDGSYRRGLIEAGTLNVARFSWDRCARETVRTLLTALA